MRYVRHFKIHVKFSLIYFHAITFECFHVNVYIYSLDGDIGRKALNLN
jgi:hypothetical protein